MFLVLFRTLVVVVTVLGGAATVPAAERPTQGREQNLTAGGLPAMIRALAGKSEYFVQTRLGRPDRTSFLPYGVTRLDYRFGREWITIRLRDGRVVDVGNDERQTGVRDDELIGYVGP